MKYIKIDKTKVATEFAGPTLKQYDDWYVLVTSGCAFLKLYEDETSFYGALVKSTQSRAYITTLIESEKYYTEEELLEDQPADWAWLTADKNDIQEDGKPEWAVRKSLAGYE